MLTKLLSHLVPAQKAVSAEQFYASAITLSDETRGRTTTYSPDAARELACYVSIVATCASRIANQCASTRIRLMAPLKRGKSKLSRTEKAWFRNASPLGPGRKAAIAANMAEDFEEIYDHPILDLLADPSGFDTGVTSAEIRFLNRMLTGNSYTLVVRGSDNAPPEELHDLCPAWVTIRPSKANFIDGYFYGRDQQERIPLQPSDVIHGIEMRDPVTPYRGRGVVASILLEHQTYMAVLQKQLATMDNQGRPDFIVSTENMPNPDQLAQLKQQINAVIQGVGKAGKFLIFPKTTSITPMQFPPKDMGESQQLKDLASSIAAAFGIAESSIFLNTANLASAEVGRVETARTAVLPRLQKDAATLNERLVPMFPDLFRRGCWLAYDNPVPEDDAQKTTTVVSLANAGILSVDEARAEVGYEPLEGELGNLPRVGGSVLAPAPQASDEGGAATGAEVVQDTALNGAQVSALLELATAVAQGQLPSETARAIAEAAFPLVDEATLNRIFGKLDAFTPEPPPGTAPTDAPVNPEADDEENDDEEPDEKTDEDAGSKAANAARVQSASTKGQATGGTGAGAPACSCSRASGVERGSKADKPPAVVPPNSLKSLAAREVTAWVKATPTLAPEGDQNEPLDVRFYRHLTAAFYRQEASILNRMDAAPFGLGTRGIRKDRLAPQVISEILRAWGIDDPRQWDRLFTDPTIGFVGEAIKAGADAGLSQLREQGWTTERGDDFYTSSERVVEAARRRAETYTETIKGVNDTTAARLREAVVGALERGEGMTKMKEAVRSAFSGQTESGVPVAEYRAAAIARTETVRAQNEGKIAGWKATEAVAGKRYLLAPGSCEFCESIAREFAGKTVPLDGVFVPMGATITGADGGRYTNDYEPIDEPPVHPNCRCTTQPVLITETA